MSRSIRRAIKPLRFLSDSAHEVAQGNFDTSLPTFKHQDEIAQLRDSFDTMQQSLKQYVEELKESTAAKASIESELNVAHNIQVSMLPKIFPPFPNRNDIDLYAIQKPAKAVGGDLYDFLIRDEKLFFCIGDVSGKGVPASLVMAVTRTLFRRSTHMTGPSRIMETMNEAISEGNDNNMFVTLFIGVLDLQTGHLRYCNAGHNAPFIQGTLLPCDSNLPIGVMPDWNFTEQETYIAPDSIILLYTDGLTEAENALHEQFGEQRITDITTSFRGSPRELIETMTDTVHLFVGDTEQSDDLTMLAIKYNK
jgi:sigma-B regulation protein RsbU (phosphoserine phosphatase)